MGAPNFIAGEYIQHLCPGWNHVPADFSASYVPDHLQYGPKGENDWEVQALEHYHDQYPNVQGAPPAAAPLAQGFDMKPKLRIQHLRPVECPLWTGGVFRGCHSPLPQLH